MNTHPKLADMDEAQLRERIVELTFALSRCREDVARLDWLENQKALVNTASCGRPHVCRGECLDLLSHYYGRTYRDAIDVARYSA